MRDVLDFIEQNGSEFYSIDGEDQQEVDDQRTIMLEIMVTPFLYRELQEMVGSRSMDDIAELIVEIINDRIL
jgi:hypothetical protein